MQWNLNNARDLFDSADLNRDNKISLSELEDFYYRVMCNSVQSEVPGLYEGNKEADRV